VRPNNSAARAALAAPVEDFASRSNSREEAEALPGEDVIQKVIALDRRQGLIVTIAWRARVIQFLQWCRLHTRP